MKTIENINEITSALTDVQKQILKDTINCGMWGDCDMEFLDQDGNVETDHCYGYCTNDAKLAGNHSGRAVSANFRAIYKKLCPYNTEIGEVISHFSDWWGDGSGDMLFIRDEYVDAFTEWEKKLILTREGQPSHKTKRVWKQNSTLARGSISMT